jgi:GNAT superfamily N-acetyltransferase
MDVRVKRLMPEMIDDFLDFFDNVAFSDNPLHARCYCQFYHTGCPNDEWDRRTADENRRATREMIVSGRMHGYLAYLDDRPVGWCHADAMAGLARLKEDCDEPEYAGKKVGVIVCFPVAPEHRRKGVATRLMSRACADFLAPGFDIVEAYPRKDSKSAAENYLGPLEMYLKDGFVITGGNEILHIVRKELTG